ncbi:MAG TPA: ATP-binding protein [Geobacteraceae bacterium]|nr:ATP-binding protein [Geobacteraceae bacterium]
MEFIDRKREIAFLQAAFKSKRSEFIVIYGKRRVGKTELVKQFFKDIPHIYFLADKTSEKEQLRGLSEKAGLLFGDEFLLSRGFGNLYEFFRYLKDKGRIVVAIDEFPFLIEANSAVPSIFQKGWDEDLQDTPIFLILLGSSIGMMETEVLGYRSPLFGRRTGQLLIEPISFWEAKRFCPTWSNEDFMYVYAILGGTPAYLLQFDYGQDFWTNIERRILAKEAYLFNEPEFILREELREPRNYFAILRALSMGKTRSGEIINETGFEKNIVGKYLSVLNELKIIRREVPITETSFEKSKKGIYIIDDNFFRFWFSFVFPNRSFIEEGSTKYVIENKIRARIDIFTSLAFEEVCRSFVKRGLLKGLQFNKTGRWWAKDAEIDVVAVNEDENTILFCEAKWSNKMMGVDILADLKKKATMVAWGGKNRKEYYALFSRRGFTPEVKRLAEQERTFLMAVNDMIQPEEG